MFASFSTNTGTPRCFSSSFLSGTSFQPSMLGAKMTVPFGKSTAPGAPMPTPATCFMDKSASSTASRTERSILSMTASTPRWALVLTLAVPMHSNELSKSPDRILVPPKSTPTTYSDLLLVSAIGVQSAFSRQYRADFFLQFRVDGVSGPHSVHDRKSVSGLQL